MHFCTWTLQQTVAANRSFLWAGLLQATASYLPSEFPSLRKKSWFCLLWFPRNSQVKRNPFISRPWGLDHQWNSAFLPNLQHTWTTVLFQVLVPLLWKTKQMNLFLKVYCPSITSKKHWQETHFTVLMKECFLLLLFPFVTSQTLGILRGLVSSNY